MLTKGLVKYKAPDGYRVRIPYLETSSSGPVVVRCSVSQDPAISESIAPGDVVIIGFEDHNADKPVILGRLALPLEGTRGHGRLVDLDVSGSANLPQDTTIGGISADSLIGFMRLASVNGDLVESMRASNETVVLSATSIRVPTGGVASSPNQAADDSHGGSDPAFSGGVRVTAKVIRGVIRAGDEVCVCSRQMCKDMRTYISADGTKKSRFRIRYRWKPNAVFVADRDYAAGESVQIDVPFGERGRASRFYTTQNGVTGNMRCVRVRRLPKGASPQDRERFVCVSNDAVFDILADARGRVRAY